MERAGQCSSVDKIRKQSGSLPASKHAVTVDDCGDAQCSRSTMHCIARADVSDYSHLHSIIALFHQISATTLHYACCPLLLIR